MELHNPGEAGVTSINNLTGDVILAAGTGITLTPVGQTITIASTADLSVTLADVSLNSTDATKSLYTMTSTIPVEFKTSDAHTLLYLDETNGNVGIGTTAPDQKLQVSADDVNTVLGSSGQISIKGLTNPNKRLNFGFDTTGDYGYIEAAIVGSGWKNLALQQNGGNVGIGTTAPGALLHLGSDAGTAASGIKFGSTGDVGLYRSAADRLRTDDNFTISGGILTNGTINVSNANPGIDFTQTTSGGVWQFRATTGATDNFDIGRSGSVKLTISNTGNVGIGTTAPGQTLTVNGGNGGLPAVSGTTQNGVARILGAGDPTLDIGVYGNTGASWLQATNKVALGTNYDLLLNPNGGNVGIGTVVPGVKLQINNADSASMTAGTAAGDFALLGTTGLFGMYMGHSSSGNGWIQVARNDSATYYNLSLQANGGNVGIGTEAPGNKLSVYAPTTADALADVMIGTSATTQKGLVIQMKASQTAKPFEVQNSAGTVKASIGADGILYSGTAWHTETDGGTLTTYLSLNNTAYLDDAGTRVVSVGRDGYADADDTIRASGGRAGSDTNYTGATFIVGGGTSTGTGIGGDLVFKTSPNTGSSGTAVNALVDRERILSRYTTLTESTATAFASVTVPTETVSGGYINYTVEANDATDFQSLSGIVQYDIVNKGGTSTIVIVDVQNGTGACSTGTLTGTITAVDAGSGVIQFKMNAVSSLTQTVLRINAHVFKNFGTGAIAAI